MEGRPGQTLPRRDIPAADAEPEVLLVLCPRCQRELNNKPHKQYPRNNTDRKSLIARMRKAGLLKRGVRPSLTMARRMRLAVLEDSTRS